MSARQHLLSLAAVLCFAVPASAAAAPRVHTTGWTATLINAERSHTGPDGRLALCQAIPPTVLTVRLRYTGVRAGTRLRLRLALPGHRERVRHVRLARSHGRVTRAFTPRGLRMRHDAFEGGAYRLRAVRGSHVLARGTLRFVGAGVC